MNRLLALVFFVVAIALLQRAASASESQDVWKVLPLDKAITTVRGDGKRRIAVFSDPNCPYCRRFEEDLAKLDNVTVHLFLFPVLGPSSVRRAKAVWCSANRAEAWQELMIYNVEPEASPDCATPVDDLIALGRKLGARVTPTWFDGTGARYQGAYDLKDLREIVEEAPR